MVRPSDTHTRVTVDLPATQYAELKTLATVHGKTLQEVITEILEQGIELYTQCPKSHEPNKATNQVMEDVKNRKNLEEIDDIKVLFKKLGN